MSKRPKKKRFTWRAFLSADQWGVFARAAFVAFGKGLVLLAIWGVIAGGAVVAYYAYDMPDIRQVTQPQRRPAITLLADDGTLFKRYGDLAGQRVALADVPPHLVHAVLAVEDRRFYSHFGVDVFGLARAAVKNARAGRMVQGGSTITQQLAKNLFLTPARTARRKVQEMLLSFWLEHTYTKDQILTAYLNRVYLGAGAYGVDAAAEVYFNKPVAALNLRESATLAGLLRAPSRYAPTNDPAASALRTRIVLSAMADAGYIDPADRALAEASIPLPRRKPSAGGDGHYFADWVVDQVSALLENAPQDITVLTTLDLKMQRAAERELDALLAAEGAAKKVEEGALVSLRPDGAVRAMVGGRDYGASQFNRATQAMRQPGSAFKPVIYLAALRHGLLSPEEMFDDAPIRIGKWSPTNYDGKYRGPVSAREALAHSINTVAVRVLQRVRLDGAIDTARALGVTSPLDPDLSLALGTNLMTPLELTGVYAALATGGRAVTPFGIKEIRGADGKILYRREEVTFPATVEATAVATLVGMLRDVVLYGTGTRAALDRPMAGKTGTSSDYRDAWFMGFTGNLITGVWMGNDDNAPMKKVTGGSLPAVLWRSYMAEAEKDLPSAALLPSLPSVQVFQPAPAAAGSSDADVLGDLIKTLTGKKVSVDPVYPE